jgi:hypothetical protein
MRVGIVFKWVKLRFSNITHRYLSGILLDETTLPSSKSPSNRPMATTSEAQQLPTPIRLGRIYFTSVAGIMWRLELAGINQPRELVGQVDEIA